MTETEIRIRSGRADKIIERAALLMLVLLWAIVLASYRSLPELIPVHFNFDGVPDRFGGRSAAFIPPVIVTAIVIGLQITSRFPHIFNDSHRTTEQNDETRRITARLIKWIQLSLAATFLLVQIMVLLFIIKQKPLNTPLILFAVALNFIPSIGFSIRKYFRSRV